MNNLRLAVRLLTTASILSIAASLAGCAPATDPRVLDRNLATAKKSTFAQQDELLAMIPTEAVASTRQTETSRALFDCEGGGYYWPGTLDIVLASDADGAALLKDIKGDWSARSGWTVEDKVSVNNDPELVIVSEEGYRHAIEFNPERNALNVLSSSACFHMAEAPKPGVDY